MAQFVVRRTVQDLAKFPHDEALSIYYELSIYHCENRCSLEPLGHLVSVLTSKVAICFSDEDTTVRVALPTRQSLEIDPAFNGPGNEAAP